MSSRLLSWSNLLVFFELISSFIGSLFLVYGFYVLLVERAQIPVCSLEMLNNQNKVLVDQLPQITVEVTGAVKNPGVWQFGRESWVGDAIKQANGISSAADKEFVAKNLNLAEVLSDGDKIYIPFDWEKETAKNNPETVSSISINHASLTELMELKGIGESRAQLIVENRPYLQIDELVTKEVISSSVFDEIRGLISL